MLPILQQALFRKNMEQALSGRTLGLQVEGISVGRIQLGLFYFGHAVFLQ
jgi:hypothetical protein